VGTTVVGEPVDVEPGEPHGLVTDPQTVQEAEPDVKGIPFPDSDLQNLSDITLPDLKVATSLHNPDLVTVLDGLAHVLPPFYCSFNLGTV